MKRVEIAFHLLLIARNLAAGDHLIATSYMDKCNQMLSFLCLIVATDLAEVQ